MTDFETIYIGSEDPDSLDARMLCDERSAYLAVTTGQGAQHCIAYSDLRSMRARFVLARNSMGEAMGCGAIRRQSYHVAEVRLFYVRLQYRGLEATLLSYLEEQARMLGYHRIRLFVTPAERSASRACESSGYRRMSDDPAVWFEKALVGFVHQ
ncbi:GNAT family N-acetyltransferase [Caballeronia sp. INDeC2]|uniref:GNAT family N-acetyltransferase n=1 Tax=Caballeronia sp. INDeC2 TaxID=2921747 RepID=UPI0020292D65|nr:GNAT family N-acetyltransferase [Caballeronia sp. INDeC2]